MKRSLLNGGTCKQPSREASSTGCTGQALQHSVLIKSASVLHGDSETPGILDTVRARKAGSSDVLLIYMTLELNDHLADDDIGHGTWV